MDEQTASLNPDQITIRLAKNEDEIKAAQKLRYRVFYEEFGATADEATQKSKMDIDSYDSFTDHLVVLDQSLPAGPEQMIGTYRLLRREMAEKQGAFYTSHEYDISPLLNSGAVLLELGRSCVLPPYRTRAVLQKLWQGIAHYVAEHKIGLMFGCASFAGTDVDTLKEQLAYLYHYHLADAQICPKALPDRYVEMNMVPKENINVKKVFMELPPLIKGYIRLGASIGNGAVIDPQFNTIDVCIVMPTHLVTDKYLKHYQRVTNNAIELDSNFATRSSAENTGAI